MPGTEVIVVTGASAGIGWAMALAFARAGARIALLARGKQGLEGTRRNVEAAGAQALVIPTDVADEQQVKAAARTVEHEWAGSISGSTTPWQPSSVPSPAAYLSSVSSLPVSRVSVTRSPSFYRETSAPGIWARMHSPSASFWNGAASSCPRLTGPRWCTCTAIIVR